MGFLFGIFKFIIGIFSLRKSPDEKLGIAEQKSADLTKSVKEAEQANEVSTQVDQESRADVDNDLSKFVRRD
jgi:hypothetical protein